MDDFWNALVVCLGHINPLYAVIAGGVYLVFGDRIRSLLARLPFKLPSLPAPAPTDPTAPKDDLNAWLEAHPLLDRLWVRLKEKFGDKVAGGKADEDELYGQLLKAIKEAGESK